DRQALGGAGMELLDVGAGLLEALGVGGGGLEGLEQLVIRERSGVGAKDLMESALGAFFGVGGVLGFGDFLGRQARDDGGRDVAVAFGLRDGVEDLIEVGCGHLEIIRV